MFWTTGDHELGHCLWALQVVSDNTLRSVRATTSQQLNPPRHLAVRFSDDKKQYHRPLQAAGNSPFSGRLIRPGSERRSTRQLAESSRFLAQSPADSSALIGWVAGTYPHGPRSSERSSTRVHDAKAAVAHGGPERSCAESYSSRRTAVRLICKRCCLSRRGRNMIRRLVTLQRHRTAR